MASTFEFGFPSGPSAGYGSRSQSSHAIGESKPSVMRPTDNSAASSLGPHRSVASARKLLAAATGFAQDQSQRARAVRSISSFSLRKRSEGGSNVTLGPGRP